MPANAMRDLHKPIGIADYEFTRALPQKFASSLPSIEEAAHVVSDLSVGVIAVFIDEGDVVVTRRVLSQ